MSSQTTSRPTQPATPAKKKRGLGRMIEALPQPIAIMLAVALFVSVWQIVVLSGAVPRLLLPSPGEVVTEFGKVSQQLVSPSGFLLGELWVTIQEILAGFMLAFVAGITIGLLVGLTEFGRKAIMPLFVMLEATPKIAFIPVFIAWFGFGMTSKIVMAAFLSVFPIIIGTVSGLNATSEEEKKLFSALRASRWATFWKLRVHRALPFLFAGLQVAIVASVTGAVAAEFIGGGTGFGEQIRVAATRIDLDRVFAMIIFLSIVGLGLYLLVTWCQRKITFWANERTPKGSKITHSNPK